MKVDHWSTRITNAFFLALSLTRIFTFAAGVCVCACVRVCMCVSGVNVQVIISEALLEQERGNQLTFNLEVVEWVQAWCGLLFVPQELAI